MTATNKPRVVLTGLEAQARIMIEASRKADADSDHKNWSTRQMVRNVFKAMWSNALPRETIEAMAKAMHSMSSVDLKPALNTLVRDGLLRSRTSGGKRLYELNFSDETV